MARPKKQLRLGVIMKGAGNHIAGWRHPAVPLGQATKLQQYVDIVRLTEAGKMDFVFIADSPSLAYQYQPKMLTHVPLMYHLEPMTLLAALAPVSRHVGLVATMSTSFNEPYNVARMFASLDHLSEGRACWNVVTTTNDYAAKNFNLEEHFAKADRYDRAEEFVDVVKGLWDSWEDDAFIADRESGIYADPAKMHVLDYRSERFAVRGPLNVPRAPQGHPVICVAAESDYGRDLGARTADMIFAAKTTMADGQAYYADVKARARAFGRDPDDIAIIYGAMVIVGATDAEAREKRAFLESCIHIDLGVQYLSYLMQEDMSQYPPDEPLPRHLLLDRSKSRRNLVIDEAERDGLTLRQVALRYADGFGHLVMEGGPKTIADEMERWLVNEATDGFVLRIPYFPEALEDFNRLVVPELQARGLLRREYTGSTFRDNLGLPAPAHGAGLQAAARMQAARSGTGADVVDSHPEFERDSRCAFQARSH